MQPYQTESKTLVPALYRNVSMGTFVQKKASQGHQEGFIHQHQSKAAFTLETCLVF